MLNLTLRLSRALVMAFMAISISAQAKNPSPAPQKATLLSGSVYERVGLAEEVDPLLLYSVSLVESARNAGKKGNKTMVRPSVYAIRTPDGPVFPKSLDEAKEALDSAVARYGKRALDVGLMQINGQHWNKVRSPYSLLNPTINVRLGARILKSAMGTTSSMRLGVGRYHSFTEWRANSYGKKVLAIYDHLQREVQNGGKL